MYYLYTLYQVAQKKSTKEHNRIVRPAGGQKSESQILEYIYDFARTYFIKNSWKNPVAPRKTGRGRNKSKDETAAPQGGGKTKRLWCKKFFWGVG